MSSPPPHTRVEWRIHTLPLVSVTRYPGGFLTLSSIMSFNELGVDVPETYFTECICHK